jgi:hypothetical protein
MGYPPPDETLSPSEIAGAGVGVAPLLRIEQRSGVLAAECDRFDEFVDRFDAELAGARAAGYLGLKSVLAYRSGLAAEPATAADAEAAFKRSQAGCDGAAPLFLTEKPLLDFLFDHATQAKYIYRHKWRKGDMVIWDNRSVLHKANPDYDMNEKRYLYRLMLKGEAPIPVAAAA